MTKLYKERITIEKNGGNETTITINDLGNKKADFSINIISNSNGTTAFTVKTSNKEGYANKVTVNGSVIGAKPSKNNTSNQRTLFIRIIRGLTGREKWKIK